MRRLSRTQILAPAAVLIGCVLAFVLLGLLVRDHPTRLDLRLHNWAVSHRGGTIGLAKVVTYGGSATAVIIATAILAAVVAMRRGGRRRVWLALLLVLAVSLSASLRLFVSRAFERARPPAPDFAFAAGGWSYPSGHTNAAAFGAGVVAFFVCSFVTSRRVRVIVVLGAVLYAVAVGWSRVWLGVHWPTDIVGGWLFAGAGLAAVWLLVRLVRSAGPARRSAAGDP